MIEITNIVLNKDRFTVYALIDGVEESNTFMPEVTAQDIKDWCNERLAFYEGLNIKLEELKNELVDELEIS